MTKVNTTLGQHLTENEITFLKAFGKAASYDGMDSSVWEQDLIDTLSLNKKERTKVITSLVKKEVILVDTDKQTADKKEVLFVYFTLADEAQKDEVIKKIVEGDNVCTEPVLTNPKSTKKVTKKETPVKPVSKNTSVKDASGKEITITVNRNKSTGIEKQPETVVTKPVKEKPVKQIATPTTDSIGELSVIESTWIDRVERRDFEKLFLQKLCTKYSCEVSVTRNKETNKDFYFIVGKEKNRKNLISEFELLIPQLRENAHKAYLESDRSLSEFKFTTAYNNTFLESKN